MLPLRPSRSQLARGSFLAAHSAPGLSHSASQKLHSASIKDFLLCQTKDGSLIQTVFVHGGSYIHIPVQRMHVSASVSEKETPLPLQHGSRATSVGAGSGCSEHCVFEL